MSSMRDSSPKKRKTKKFNKKRFFIWILITCAVAVFSAMAVYLMVIFNGEKLLKKNMDKLHMDEATVIYDSNGNEVTKLYSQYREKVSYSDVPKQLKEAFIATEDRRFEQHEGVDLWAIGRALVKDVIHRSAMEGGSTITQQVAKNMFLSNEKTVFRKATEVSIALALENNFTKDEILEMYMNRIFFGNGAYGVKAAAEIYFGKTMEEGSGGKTDLTLGEMATLAGMPKAPSIYNPISNPEEAQKRRAVVIRLMYDQHYITKEEMEKANAEKFHPSKQITNQDYMTYKDYVIDEAVQVTGLSEDELNRNGYKIYTTMDSKAQKVLESTFANAELFPKDGPKDKVQGSMVIMNQKTGGLVAMIGGRDYGPKGWNRAVKPRQPGSSFKPIAVYAPALETGNWGPYSMLKDEKMSFGDYRPSNYNNQYLGEVTMTDAIKHSINLPAVWLLNEIGINKGIQFARKLGINLDSRQDRNLSIALGGLTKGVSPLQMAEAYSAFANNGVMNKAHSIVKILDADDREIYVYKPMKKQVMSAQTAYYITKMLQTVVEPGGTGKRAKMDRPVAGKTGSTQVGINGVYGGYRDIWFAGYTPEWTAAVWMGFDKTAKNQYLHSDSGQTAAMFKAVMSKALEGRKITSFEKPRGVVEPKEPVKTISDLQASYTAEKHEVTLQWSVLDEALQYRVYRKKADEDNFTMLTAATKPNVSDLAILNGATYLYYVVSVDNDNNESEKSNVVSISIPEEQPSTEPSQPPLTEPSSGGGTGDQQSPPVDGSSGSPGEGGTADPNAGGQTPAQGDGTAGGTPQNPSRSTEPGTAAGP